MTVANTKLVILGGALDAPIFECVDFAPVESVKDATQIASGDLAPVPILVEQIVGLVQDQCQERTQDDVSHLNVTRGRYFPALVRLDSR